MIEIVEEGDGGVFPTNELGWSCLINKVETRKVQAHPLIVAEIKHRPFAITILEAGPVSIFFADSSTLQACTFFTVPRPRKQCRRWYRMEC